MKTFNDLTVSELKEKYGIDLEIPSTLPSIRKPEDLLGLPEVVEAINSKVELFGTIYLNAANVPIKAVIVNKGCLNNTTVHPRETFRGAVLEMSASIVLFHNHPSGSLKASKEDIAITNQLTKAGKILGIPVLDHLIVTKKGFTSLKGEGLVED